MLLSPRAQAAEDIPRLVCREEWGAAPFGPALKPHTIDRITIHHSASGAPRSPTKTARLLRSFQAAHRAPPKRYPDIAYHLLVDFDGRVWEGRPLWARGDTPTNYDPAGHLLICLIGNFERGPPPPAQWAALVSVVAWASGEWHIPLEKIAGHRDHASTLCPGRHLHTRIIDGTLRKAVEGRIDGGGARFERKCPQRGRG